MLKKLHHVAYRCRDAAETVDFYTNGIGMTFAAAIVQDKVPSIGADSPHNHIFFEMEDGSHIAFFDILGSDEPMTPVENDWAQHLALEVASEEKAEEIAARLRARGVDVLGPVAHGEIARSWYFYDPNGHRMEVTTRHPAEQGTWDKLKASAMDDLARWQARKAEQRASA